MLESKKETQKKIFKYLKNQQSLLGSLFSKKLKNEILKEDPNFNFAQIENEKERYKTEILQAEIQIDWIENAVKRKEEDLKNLDLEIKILSGEVQKKYQKPKNQSYVKMLYDLESLVCPEIKDILQKFFEHFDTEQQILSWNKLNKSKYFLRLKETLKMWVPTIDENGKEDPIGGIVVIMKPEVTMSLQKNKCVFDDGFNGFCKYLVPVFNCVKEIHPCINRLTFENRQSIQFGAGVKIMGHCFVRDRKKSYDYLIKNWGKNGVVIKNHVPFLLQKYKEALKKNS